MADLIVRKKFSARLQKLMDDKEIKQKDIVTASEGIISYSNVNHWLNGIYPAHDRLVLLHNILEKLTKGEVSFTWLMGIGDEPTEQ